MRLDQKFENERWKQVGHQHHREHAGYGHLGKRAQSRVLGYDKRAYAYKHD